MGELPNQPLPREPEASAAPDETRSEPVMTPEPETRNAWAETRLAGGHTPSEPYTVHGDAVADTDAPMRRRGGPDPIALVAGLVALVVAALAATGTLDLVDPRWVLAAGAVLVGGSVLVASLRRRA